MGEHRFNLELIALGKRIKKIRVSKNLTQEDLALHAGMDRTNISKLEKGEGNPEFFTLVRIAEALDVRLSEFFGF